MRDLCTPYFSVIRARFMSVVRLVHTCLPETCSSQSKGERVLCPHFSLLFLYRSNICIVILVDYNLWNGHTVWQVLYNRLYFVILILFIILLYCTCPVYCIPLWFASHLFYVTWLILYPCMDLWKVESNEWMNEWRETTITSIVYLDMLQQFLIPQLDEDDQKARIHFQQHGAPPHYLGDLHEYPNIRFPCRWICRAAPIAWPPRSPDLTALDFFLCGFLKPHMRGRVSWGGEEYRQTHVRGWVSWGGEES
jgi:hypothetical protein